MKRQPTEGKNIFTNDTSDKGLIARIYEKLIQHQKNKQSNLKMGTSGQVGGIGRYTVPLHTTKRRTTANLKRKNKQN